MKKIIAHGEGIYLCVGNISQPQYEFWKTQSESNLRENLSCMSPGCQQAGEYNFGGDLKLTSNVFFNKALLLSDSLVLITEDYTIRNNSEIKNENLGALTSGYHYASILRGNSVFEISISDSGIDLDQLEVCVNNISGLKIITAIKYKTDVVSFSEVSSVYDISSIQLFAPH